MILPSELSIMKIDWASLQILHAILDYLNRKKESAPFDKEQAWCFQSNNHSVTNTILSSKLANSVQVTSPLAPLRKEHKIFTAIQPCSGWGYHHAMALSTTSDIVEAEYMAANNDAMNVRDAWVTVGSFNWDTRGGPFGTLPEGSKSSFGWQPLHSVTCSEVLPPVKSTIPILWNWLGTSSTRLSFFIVARPIIKSTGEESKIIALIVKVFILFTRSLR